MNADNKTPSSLTDWQFGPNWPGLRCGAKTRRGTPCLKAAIKGKKRCRNHGGRSTGVSGERNGNYKHGRSTKQTIANRRASAARVRALFRMCEALGMFKS